MSAIDPAIQQLIDQGREATAVQAAEAQAMKEEEAAVVRQRWDDEWTALETAVAQLLPKEIAKFAKVDRQPNANTGLTNNVAIEIPYLCSFWAVFNHGHGGWSLREYFVAPADITGRRVGQSYRFRANQLPQCLAEVANQTERQVARNMAVADYELTVAEWKKAFDAAEAVREAMTNSLQKQVCEHYGDRFALWQIHYSHFDEDSDLATDTAVVLENETDPLGFWREVNRAGSVRRISYNSVFAVEALGDHEVVNGEYTKRLYGGKLGTIYLPPYVTDSELSAAKDMLDKADAHAPELPERPRPHDMETAVLFEKWELDWLYANMGGDADN